MRSLKPPSQILPCKREMGSPEGAEPKPIKTNLATPTKSRIPQSPSMLSLEKKSPIRNTSKTTIEVDFSTRKDLESLKEIIQSKEEVLEELKTESLTLQTQIQKIEVDNGDLEAKFSELNKQLALKRDTLINLNNDMNQLEDEMKTSLNISLRELKAESDRAIYDLQKDYMKQIEDVQELKIGEIKKEKQTSLDSISQVDAKIKNNNEYLQQLMKTMEDNYHNEHVKIKDHMEQLRTSLDTDLLELRQQKEAEEKNLLKIKEEIYQKKKEEALAERKLDDIKTSNSSQDALIRQLKEQIEIEKKTSAENEAFLVSLENDITSKTSKIMGFQTDLIKEESLRRVLHNTLQDLKGNIRVFCRIRPPLANELSNDILQIRVPDNEEEEQTIEVKDPKIPTNSFNSNPTSSNPQSFSSFKFNRVFQMNSTNEEIFEEISQLSQSALDGLNVCVFAYGQTGSGKTFTMFNEDGMIPRVVDQIFETSENLEKRGWKHKISTEFLEIYNENIKDLLADPSTNLEKIKYEIRHDTINQKTSVTDLIKVEVESSEQMNELLKRALKNRSIASTKANERSSRSHTVFIIKINGYNSETGESIEGILNLIDLAGSERLSNSQVTGDRLKETQSINKSLSCLGDVIYALNDGNSRTHIPFRNSKLTYLLQYSLMGNSKTLMFVNISPLAKYHNETINSLRFATKVNNTKIK